MRERERGEGVQKPAESSSGAYEVIDESLVDPTESSDSSLRSVWLTVATQLFHLGTVQLAAVADHSLHPMHLTSSHGFHGRTNKFSF